MTDDLTLAQFGKYTPEGKLTPGYGNSYLFFVGRDNCHQILLDLITNETLGFDFNQYGYADDELNQAILTLIKNPNVTVQGTLDKSQAGGVHEKQILSLDETSDPNFLNSIAIGQSATHQISHTKGGICVSRGIWFEGSTNWSKGGEGVGISLKPGVKPLAGYAAQNNTLLVSTNSVGMSRFRTQLAIEHRVALAQMAKSLLAPKQTA